jgi:hypothetical protein
MDYLICAIAIGLGLALSYGAFKFIQFLTLSLDDYTDDDQDKK